MPGIFTPGFPTVGSAVYPVLQGGEKIPADTTLNEPASVALTPFQLAAFAVGISANTATATAGAATLNTKAGTINTGALTTAAGATTTLTLTNSAVTTATNLFAQVYNGTNTGGVPSIQSVTVANGTATIVILNNGPSAFNGTLLVMFHIPQTTEA